MIFLIIAMIGICILLYKDPEYVYHWLWFLVTVFYILSITGCTSIPTTEFDNQPFIYIE